VETLSHLFNEKINRLKTTILSLSLLIPMAIQKFNSKFQSKNSIQKFNSKIQIKKFKLKNSTFFKVICLGLAIGPTCINIGRLERT